MENYIRKAIKRRWQMIATCSLAVVLLTTLLGGVFYFIGVAEGEMSSEDYKMGVRIFSGLAVIAVAIVVGGIIKQVRQNNKVWMMYQVMTDKERQAFEKVLARCSKTNNQMIISDSALCAIRTKLGIANAENDCILFLFREVTELVYSYSIVKHAAVFELYVYTGKMKQKLNLVKDDDAIKVYQLLKEKCPHVPTEFKGMSKPYFMEHGELKIEN